MIHSYQLKTTATSRWPLMFCLISLLLITLPSKAEGQSDAVTYFYVPATIGSDSIYNPLHAFFSYSLDTLQLPDNFAINDFNDNLDDAVHQLSHPRASIENEGGFTQFIIQD